MRPDDIFILLLLAVCAAIVFALNRHGARQSSAPETGLPPAPAPEPAPRARRQTSRR